MSALQSRIAEVSVSLVVHACQYQLCARILQFIIIMIVISVIPLITIISILIVHSSFHVYHDHDQY